MENYKKGKNVEPPLERDMILIENLPKDFLWMQVRGGSKIRNLLTHALNEFPQAGSVVWTGYGPAVGKTITCAEIMKRECGNTLHQLNKLCYRLVEEYWDPIIPELDQIVVKRKLPMIHIFLSRERINDDNNGYQAPGSVIKYQPVDTPTNSGKSSKKKKNNSGKTPKTSKVS